MPSDRSQVYIPRERWSPELAQALGHVDDAVGPQEDDTNYPFAFEMLRGTWREQVSEQIVAEARANAIRLWPQGAPGAGGVGWRHEPLLYPVLPAPDRANGSAVVVIPGGGYRVQVPWEAFPFAEWFAERGVAAFVLQYRLLPYVLPAPLDDTQRAIRTVRARAGQYGIDPARVAVIGFSAGGHLAALASSLFDEPDPLMEDTIASASARPDLAILFYPAICLRILPDLRVLALGTNQPDEALLDRYSAQVPVSERTTPAFIVGSVTDQIIAPAHLIAYAQALADHGVSYELHLYSSGVHGSGVYDPRPTHRTWEALLHNWLRAQGFIQ